MSEPQNARETQVSALFDSELDEATSAEVERALADDPMLSEDLEDFGHLKRAIVADLEREASEVPGARFEQVWDEIERGIAASTAESVQENRGLRGLFETLLSGWRAPLTVGAAACVVAVVVFRGPSDGDDGGLVATAPDAVETAGPAAEAPPTPGVKEAPPAAGTLVSYERPEVFDGEVEAVEFSGVRGQILQITDQEGTQRGLTIWIDEIEDEEEEEAADGGHRI